MATWAQVSGRSRSVYSIQALTEGKPAAGDGVLLSRDNLDSGVQTILPIVHAPAGQTLTGAGDLRAWLYLPAIGDWVRIPRADQDLVDLAGLAAGVLEPIRITWTSGRFALVFSSLGVSGGTDPELDLHCLGPTGQEI